MEVARPAGFEPATTRLEGGCSIQLSYGRMLFGLTYEGLAVLLMQSLILYGAPGEIRTPDPLVRSQILYPTELRAREAGTIGAQAGSVNAGGVSCRTFLSFIRF